jgi:hypothetical protein
MFVIGEDGTFELLTRGLVPRHHEPIYGEALYYPANSSTSSAPNNICSCLNPYAGSYYLSTMTSQGYPIRVHIFQPSAGTLSSTSTGSSVARDSIEDYPEIRGNICWKAANESRQINMVGPARAPSQNSSNRYPTIRGSKVSDT